MKKLMTIRLKSGAAGLALVLASAMPGSAAVLHVPADYSTIQAAVDAAASGDEIQIAAGVYTNQVVIVNKNLTLSGSPGTVLRATPDMQWHYTISILEVRESDVAVSGLTFEGERVGDSYTNGYSGVFFLGAGGRVEDCRFSGFRGTTGTNGGGGIVFEDPLEFGYGTADAQVLRSVFADNAVSIGLMGDPFSPNTLTLNFAVNDNTIVGDGPDATGQQFGIEIWGGAGGEVKRNTITNYAYTVTPTSIPFPFSYGILAIKGYGRFTNTTALQPIHFEGNILRNNQIGMALLAVDDSTIVNNSFEGPTPGYRPGGLNFSGDNVLAGTNRFSDMETGIILFGDDHQFGTYVGIASNAVLTANSFCNVATNYFFEPLTTYDLQSTLGCDPTLNVSRGVLLSWPYAVQGYSVQTAPTPDGPWTNSDATVFQQDEENRAAIPMDTNQQYFQLVKQP